MKGQLKLVKGVLYRKTILDNSAERKPKFQLNSAQLLDYKSIEVLSQSSMSSRYSKNTQSFERKILLAWHA